MKYLYKKPYLYFWLASIFILIIGYKTYIDIGGFALDINVHDTYFIIAHKHLIFTLSGLIFIPGFVYLVLEKLKINLNTKLTIVHTCTTVLSIFSYPLVEFYFNKTSKSFPLFYSHNNINSFTSFLIIFVLIGQLFFIMNLAISIFKSFNKVI